MTYYVYAHYKKGEENIPFYVGKGIDRRAFEKCKRSKHWKAVVKKYGYDIRILHEGLSETDAFWIECKLIGMFGRADKGLGPLVNHTGGGEGASGAIRKPEDNKRKSEKMKGRKYDEERRKNIAKGKIGNNYNLGKKRDEKTKKFLSERQLAEKNCNYGKIFTEEEKLRWSNDSPKKKTYEIEKDGVVEIVTGMNKFCKDHDLIVRSMHRACTNGYRHRGYSIKRLS
jgi:hypothetical protein